MAKAKKKFYSERNGADYYTSPPVRLEAVMKQPFNPSPIQEDFKESAVIDPITKLVLDRYTDLLNSGKMEVLSSAQFEADMVELRKRKPAWMENKTKKHHSGSSQPS